MTTLLALAPILAVLAMGVVSPGPSFILVARTAVAHSRRAALASALGMAAGATTLALAALFGLHALISRLPSAYLALQLLGGAYLLYLAWKTWRSAREPLPLDLTVSAPATGLPRHFCIAFATMLGNPKAIVQYGVIFAATLPAAPSVSLLVALPIGVFALELSWYLAVAFVLSSAAPRRAYLRMKTPIDRAAGLVLGALGARLLESARSRI